MKTIFFPHKTLSGDLKLKLSKAQLDDDDPPKDPFAHPDLKVMQLFDQDKEDWEELKFNVELNGPAEEIERLKDSTGEPEVIVVAECSLTQFRMSAPLELLRPGTWYGSVGLDRCNLRGKVKVWGFITGIVGSRGARYLGRSDEWSILIDEPSEDPIKGTLQVQWVKFDEPPADLEYLAAYSDDAFFSNLDQEVPKVYLNNGGGFEALPALLGDRRNRTSQERAHHDSERVGIARSIWLAMLNTAMAGIIEPEEDGGDPAFPVEDWKKSVLNSLLPLIYPEVSRDEYLLAAYGDWNSGNVGNFEAKAQAMINRYIDAGKLLRHALRKTVTRGES